MRKSSVLALTFLALAAGPGECLELKNGRPSYGPLLGPTRPNSKYLPGDFLYYNFEVARLTTKEKTGIASYQQTLELTNKDNKVIYKQGSQPQEIPLIPGSSLPGSVQIFLPPDTTPGPYKLKVTVTDRGVTPASTKELLYDFELLKPSFGIVAASAPAAIFTGQDLPLTFAIVEMRKDPKTKMPDVDVAVRILDEQGQPAYLTPFVSNVKDLHNPELGVDLTKVNVVPISNPFAMTRPGRFTIEIRAHDKLAREERTLRLPVTVIDPGPYLDAGK